jgi:glycerophosphoryl diester phosphodiesterase
MSQRIIAHRGHKTEAPEQTMAAYRMAVELGAEMIEADVQLSRDGVAVMMHDWTLERTTNGHGSASGLDWAEIAALDAGSWFDPRFAGERVPLLDDLFALAKETGIALCLEAKGETLAANLEVSRRIGQEIARRGRLDVDVLASFDHEALRVAASEIPGLRTAPDRLPEHGESTAEALLRQAWAIGAPIIQHHFADLRPEVAAEVQAAGVEIWAWPPTSPEEVAVAIASGAIGIMGDDVRNIAAALRR